MQLRIKKLGINGEGIAFDRRVPVFLDGCLPDEKVEAKITEDHGKYKFAELVRVIDKSPHRVHPECPHFSQCRACPLMILDYEQQLIEKGELIKESLMKYAGISVPDFEIIENDSRLAYRNSCKLPFGMANGKLITGLYRKGSNDLIPIDNCIIQEKHLNDHIREILRVLNRFGVRSYNKKTKEGARFLYIRVFGDQWQCCLVKGTEELPSRLIQEIASLEGLKVFSVSVNTDPNTHEIFGRNMKYYTSEKELRFNWHGYDLRLSPKAFFQLNTEQSFRLFDKAISLISGHKKHIMEAYCGIGVISLLASKKADKITAFEIIPDAVRNARKIAAENGISNIQFECSDAGTMLSKVNDCDLLIVDPPRSGMDDKMIRAIEFSKIPEILYISCSHMSFAKNLKDLKHYQLEELSAIDMFSNTPLVEIVAKLVRKHK